jgi:hypothetical protein
MTLHAPSAGLCVLMAFCPVFCAEALKSPSAVQVVFSETSLDINWDSVPGAIGYNLYDRDPKAGKKEKRRKINPALITSGTHFLYIWDFEDGKRVRKIKGYEHHLSVAAVFDVKGREKEGPFSRERDNCYFEGFRNVTSARDIERILVPQQAAPKLPVDQKPVSRTDFIRFMEGPGKLLYDEMNKVINPLEVGACAPVSTILVKLLDQWGISAYRVEGTFIKEFHTFVVLNIEGVEYVLDFTADQFLPGVAPVFFPRDLANLNASGRLGMLGVPVYQSGKVFSAGQTDLAQNKAGEIYRTLLEKASGLKKETANP